MIEKKDYLKILHERVDHSAAAGISTHPDVEALALVSMADSLDAIARKLAAIEEIFLGIEARGGLRESVDIFETCQ